MSDIDRLVVALKAWANGPDWRQTAQSGLLSANGGRMDPDEWYPVPPAVRAREGNPAIGVFVDRQHAATVTCSPSGRNVTVFVPKGTKVIEVEQ